MLYTILNYFDTTLPIEKVQTEGVHKSQLTRFNLILRLFNTVIEYSLGYLIVKFFQFLIHLLTNKAIQEISLIYILAPLVFFIEIGASKRYLWSTVNFVLFLLRSTFKVLLFFLVDLVVIKFFS